jgi:hypothetical protein
MPLGASFVGAFSAGTITLYTRAFRKAPFFTSAPTPFADPSLRNRSSLPSRAEPWELAICMGLGAWVANKALSLEEYYAAVGKQYLLEKMARNQVPHAAPTAVSRTS